MSAQETSSLALIVRSGPYEHRSARAEFDVALAALVMDYRIEVYFLGAALLQLLAERDVSPALLPAAYRAWASLPDLGDVSFFAEVACLDRYPESQFRWLLPVHGMQAEQMQEGWRRCNYSIVL